MACKIKKCVRDPQGNRQYCQYHYRKLIFIPTHPLYDSWIKMRRNASVPVCRDWREDYYAFESDLIMRPSHKHQITLIDPNGRYEPSNVEWTLPLHNKAYNKKNVSSNNTSGAVGVAYSKRESRWIASITVQTRRIYLGRFVSRTAAIRARKMAEQRFEGMINADSRPL